MTLQQISNSFDSNMKRNTEKKKWSLKSILNNEISIPSEHIRSTSFTCVFTDF